MGMTVQLSMRLTAIAGMITEGNRLVDVGCDHGYLPVYLISEKKIPKAIAADVGKGPLARAREHIAKYNLGEYIETRLCDGLSGINPGEGDSLVIAGMGGPLMEKILSANWETTDSFQELVLQPQSDIPHFRKFLMENGYSIIEEKIILEDGKFYPMMKSVRKQEQDSWTVEELMFGRYLLAEKNPVLHKFLLREMNIQNKILTSLRTAETKEALHRRNEVEEEKLLIQAALDSYES